MHSPGRGTPIPSCRSARRPAANSNRCAARCSSRRHRIRGAPRGRVGLLYFDLTHNCPRLSIALLREGQTAEDWHDAEIAWVDVILETDKIDPARDVVGGGGAEGALAASGDKEAVCTAIERAGAEAAAGRSPYARPRVELDGRPDVALVNEAGGPQVNGPATVRLRVSGFSEGKTPRVFWRREGFATDGGRGSTHWMELPGAALATDGAGATAPDGTPLPGVSAMTASLDLGSPGPDGTIALAGHTVQLLFVDAVTAQAAGASFTIGAN